MDAMETYRELIKENISCDILRQKCDAERLDEILDIMLETVYSRKQQIRIAGEDMPAEAVKNRLLRLNDSHIEYVLECLDQNTTKIRNIRSYLLTALYQAPTTISSYYAARVSHDLYGGNEVP
jgi:transposase